MWINGSAVPNPAQYLSHCDNFNTSDYLNWSQSENLTLNNGLLQIARLKVRTSEEKEGLVLWLRFDEGNKNEIAIIKELIHKAKTNPAIVINDRLFS